MSYDLIFSIIIWLLFAFFTMLLAGKYKRNQVLAFILGLLFGVFALLWYWIAGEKKSKKK